MKFIFAPDSFKGSLSAAEICDILEKVTARRFPGAEMISIPVADGGEGTTDALLRADFGQKFRVRVTGPMFEPEDAIWGMLGDGRTAVMEMAQAAGLPLVAEAHRDPRRTTTYGVGEMIRNAIQMGATDILLGIGGSATNDCGMGMLAALGAHFLDEDGREVEPVGGNLGRVARADFSGLMPELKDTGIVVICDVTNPLLGENGATYIYGPQKGATPGIRDELEAGMAHFADLVSKELGHDIASFPGAGAAGGLGAALNGVLGAKLESGIDAVLNAVRFDQKLNGVDLAVTGEGRIDGQSVRFGKVPVGVARRCAEKGIPVLAIVGGIADGAEGLFDICESTIQTTVPGPIALEKAMRDAASLYEAAADRLLRAVAIGMKIGRK